MSARTSGTMSESARNLRKQEMMVTRHKSNQFKRKLRDKDRSMKKITQLLMRSPNKNKPLKTYGSSKSTKLSISSTKVTKSNPKKQKVRKNSVIKRQNKKDTINAEKDTKEEFYPTKVKRDVNPKKITLKPKHELKKIDIVINKRKRSIPQKGIPYIESPVISEKSTTQKDEELSPISSPEPSISKLIEDTDSLTNEDFLEILTCPSPVWWEDLPDMEYIEEPLKPSIQSMIKQENSDESDQVEVKSQTKIKYEKSEETNQPEPECLDEGNVTYKNSNVEISSTVQEIATVAYDEKFLKKRSALESFLSSIKTKNLAQEITDVSCKSLPTKVDCSETVHSRNIIKKVSEQMEVQSECKNISLIKTQSKALLKAPSSKIVSEQMELEGQSNNISISETRSKPLFKPSILKKVPKQMVVQSDIKDISFIKTQLKPLLKAPCFKNIPKQMEGQSQSKISLIETQSKPLFKTPSINNISEQMEIQSHISVIETQSIPVLKASCLKTVPEQMEGQSQSNISPIETQSKPVLKAPCFKNIPKQMEDQSQSNISLIETQSKPVLKAACLKTVPEQMEGPSRSNISVIETQSKPLLEATCLKNVPEQMEVQNENNNINNASDSDDSLIDIPDEDILNDLENLDIPIGKPLPELKLNKPEITISNSNANSIAKVSNSDKQVIERQNIPMLSVKKWKYFTNGKFSSPKTLVWTSDTGDEKIIDLVNESVKLSQKANEFNQSQNKLDIAKELPLSTNYSKTCNFETSNTLQSPIGQIKSDNVEPMECSNVVSNQETDKISDTNILLTADEQISNIDSNDVLRANITKEVETYLHQDKVIELDKTQKVKVKNTRNDYLAKKMTEPKKAGSRKMPNAKHKSKRKDGPTTKPNSMSKMLEKQDTASSPKTNKKDCIVVYKISNTPDGVNIMDFEENSNGLISMNKKKPTQPKVNAIELKSTNNQKIGAQKPADRVNLTNSIKRQNRIISYSDVLKEVHGINPYSDVKKKSIAVSDSTVVNYCLKCSSIFDTEQCKYCDKKLEK